MHKIGDKVVYGANGVMTVVDIREELFDGLSRSYYVLSPVEISTDSLTFVPCDNERLVEAMHPLLTKEEAIDLIRRSKEIPPVDWIEASRARTDYFKKIMESGDREAIFGMIAAIDRCAKRREAEGKKNFIADENARAKAQRLLYSEFSVVLSVPEDQISAYIDSIEVK